MRRIVTFGLCALAVPMLAAGQTKDNFEYWDTNQNGDLTCPEAKDGPDGGLRLPAYEDDRDGTGIIYQWLERSRSSDTDNDGVACESTPNAGGYVPNVQPVEPQGLPGGRRDLARAADLRGAAAGGLRPRRLRVRVLEPGGRHHRHVAVHDEGRRAGLYAVIRRTPALRSRSGRTAPRQRTSSTSWRSPRRTTAESLTTGAGTSRLTWTTSRSRIRE